jgi:hypothetical protein
VIERLIVKGATEWLASLARSYPHAGFTARRTANAALQLWVLRGQRERRLLTGIRNNLSRSGWQYPDHPLAKLDPLEAAKQVRTYGEHGDEMARRLFDQQAMALGRLFTIAANFTDPDAYFIGGGVIETTPEFRGGSLP